MSTDQSKSKYGLQPFRRAVFRGFGVVLPPILTIAILMWLANSFQTFVLNPVEWASRETIVRFINDTKTEVPETAVPVKTAEDVKKTKDKNKADALATSDVQPTPEDIAATDRLVRILEQRLGIQLDLDAEIATAARTEFKDDNRVYVALANGEWIPQYIYNGVIEHTASTGATLKTATGRGYYEHYVDNLMLRKVVVIPFFLAGFILLMYLLGKFLAAGVGRFLWNAMERVITQLPIIRTVYSSVKQVTDFFVGESDIEFKRVVAVEYPRKGVWSVGFVTGESMSTIRDAADRDPIMSILMPTSPVPGTGFTISVRKSETIELNIPIDQALQFVVSCGVVIPDNELQSSIESQISSKALNQMEADGIMAIEPR